MPENMTPDNKMMTPNQAEAVGTTEHDGKQGGSISTVGFSEEETRPQELHGAVAYQTKTSNGKPEFIAYTDLTANRG